ncbi:MAG: hypothetical protein ACYSUR_13025 [Planctomycetota bacterium]|jgi:hypothetical protein
MKTKGITIWERHAEKFVLAVAALLFVAFTALQFIGEPNAVSTSKGDIAPGDIDELLEDQAARLQAKLSDDADAGVELPDPQPALDQLISELDRSLSPAPTLSQWSFAVAPSVEGIQRIREELPVPRIKAPARVAVAQTADALADGVVEIDYPELAELFPEPGQPHDLTFVTVATELDLADLRRQFRGEGADGGANVIPSSWFDDRPENIVDVAVEREEFLDGNWVGRTTLEPIPGQVSFRAQLAAGELDAALRDDVLGRLSDPAFQLALVQPTFYRLKNEDLTIPVVQDEDADEEALALEEQIKNARERLARWERERDRLLQELENKGGTRREGGVGGDDRGGGPAGGSGRSGGTGRRAPPGRGGPRDAPGKGGGTGFGEGEAPGPGKRPGSGGPEDGMSEAAERRLNQKIDRAEARVIDELQNLRDLGVNVDDEEQDEFDPGGTLQEDKLLAFGHDLTVEPGRTYHYRVTVKVFNPFFGKKRNLVESQEHLAESFTLESAASPWSDPVRVNPALRVFITRAAPPGARGAGALGRATAEVYRFYDGRHWMEKFTVPAGGYIGGIKAVKLPDGQGTVEVDFRTDLFVLDIVADIDDGTVPGRGVANVAGPGAKVLLQDIRTGEVLELRDPQVELRCPERRDLRDDLALADSGGRRPL